MLVNTIRSTATDGGDRAISRPILVFAGLSALVIGYLASTNPTLLHLRLSPTALLLVASGMTAGFFVLRRPGLALVLLLVIVYLNLSDILIRFHGLPSVLQILAIPFVVAAWLANQDRPRALRSTFWLTAPLIVYWLVLLLSTTTARDPGLADARVLEVAKALVVYLLVVLLVDEPRKLRWACWSLVVAGTALAALGVFQSLTGSTTDAFGGLARVERAHLYGTVFESRIAGPVGDPNYFAQILIVPLALGAVLAASERDWRLRLAGLGGAIVITSAIVLTYSRGGALAMGVVLLLVAFAHRRRLGRAVLAIGFVALLASTLPGDFMHRLTTLGEVIPGREDTIDPDSSFENRRLLVGTAWRIFLDHPWTGVGAGNYTVHFPAYADRVGPGSGEYEDPEGTHYPHNLYLEIGAETGLLGLGLFAIVLLSCFVHLQSVRARLPAGSPTAALAHGIQLALVGFLVSSLFLHGHFPRYLWLLFGLAAASHRVASITSRERSPIPAGWANE